MSDQLPQSIAFANALADAQLLPDVFRKNPANILFAAEIARDLNVSPVTAMRGIYVTQGRVGFHSHFMLALANRARVFESPVTYHVAGSGDDLEVTASVTLRGGHLAEETVSMEMAKAEGWTRNSKYRTMPVQMLKKRAVRMLIDNHCPEVLSGMGVGDDDHGFQDEPKRASTVERLLDRVQHSAPKALPNIIEALEDPAPAPLPEPEAWDFGNPRHRDMVTAAIDTLNLSADWRKKHGTALRDYLRATPPPADPAEVFARVEYFVASHAEVSHVEA